MYIELFACVLRTRYDCMVIQSLLILLLSIGTLYLEYNGEINWKRIPYIPSVSYKGHMQTDEVLWSVYVLFAAVTNCKPNQYTVLVLIKLKK